MGTLKIFIAVEFYFFFYREQYVSRIRSELYITSLSYFFYCYFCINRIKLADYKEKTLLL